jgi:DNA-binding response OmpR family regulator
MPPTASVFLDMVFQPIVDPEDRVRVLEDGFLMYLPKPVDPAELIEAVARLGRRTPARQAGPVLADSGSLASR